MLLISAQKIKVNISVNAATHNLYGFLFIFFNLFFNFTFADEIVDIEKVKKEWLNTLVKSEVNDIKYFKRLEWSNRESEIFLDISLSDISGITRSLTRIKKLLLLELSYSQKSLVENALLKVLNRYNSGIFKHGNWWDWEIGIPLLVNEIIILSDSWLDKKIKTQLIAATRFYLPYPNFQNAGYSSLGLSFQNKGANRADTVFIHLQRAVIENDAQSFTNSLKHLWSVLDYVSDGDGFYRDGSFIQHEDILYTGSYGLVLYERLALILKLIHNTSFAPDDHVYKRILKLFEKSVVPFMYKGIMSDIASGRAVSRSWEQGKIRGSRFIQILESFKYSFPYRFDIQISTLLNESKSLTQNDGGFFFPQTDKFTYKNIRFFATLSMHSSRSGNYECINGENLKGWYHSDGMLSVYTHKHDFNDVLPLLDASSLPGTTTEAHHPSSCEGQRNVFSKILKDERWVGGVVFKNYSSLGMNYKSENGNVSALKSWFFIDDFIVALGSDIIGANNTNIFQNFSSNQQYLSWENIGLNNFFILRNFEKKTSLGVFFPKIQHYSFKKELTSGDWLNVNRHSSLHMSKTSISSWRARLDLIHDRSEVGSYSYILFPNWSISELINFQNTNKIEVLRNDSTLHALKYTSSSIDPYHIYMVNKYRGKSTVIIPNTLGVTGVASMVIKHSEKIFEIAVSDPEWSNHYIQLHFSDKVAIINSDNRVTLNNNTVQVNMHGLNGSKYFLRLIKETKK